MRRELLPRRARALRNGSKGSPQWLQGRLSAMAPMPAAPSVPLPLPSVRLRLIRLEAVNTSRGLRPAPSASYDSRRPPSSATTDNSALRRSIPSARLLPSSPPLRRSGATTDVTAATAASRASSRRLGALLFLYPPSPPGAARAPCRAVSERCPPPGRLAMTRSARACRSCSCQSESLAKSESLRRRGCRL